MNDLIPAFYHPDFLVRCGGSIYLVETKAQGLVTGPGSPGARSHREVIEQAAFEDADLGDDAMIADVRFRPGRVPTRRDLAAQIQDAGKARN